MIPGDEQGELEGLAPFFVLCILLFIAFVWYLLV